MKARITFTTLAALLGLTGAALAAADAPPNPYAGQEARSIKSLSDADVAGLLAGKGAGLAKAAELNGYPGPAHVLELAAPLKLDVAQVEATRQLMAAHRSRASQLGAEPVASERALDTLFAERRADRTGIDRATQRVGELQARLRAEHLATHLTQTALLSADQVRRYGELRGYADAIPSVAPAGNNPSPDHSSHRH